MITIINNKLFNELKQCPEWKTLFNEKNFEPKITFPELAGGLDHIEVKKRGIYFHDIGSSVNGNLIDNSFVIRPEKKEVRLKRLFL